MVQQWGGAMQKRLMNSKCRKKQALICNLILPALLMNLSFTSLVGSRGGWEVDPGNCSWSLLLLFTCIVLHGNQDDRKWPFCWYSIFLYDQHWSTGRTHTHIYALGTRDSPLQRLRCAHKENGRRKQIRRGARYIFRGTGSTSEGPLISHNAAKLNTRWKWRRLPHVAESTFIHALTSFGFFLLTRPQLCRQ